MNLSDWIALLLYFLQRWKTRLGLFLVLTTVVVLTSPDTGLGILLGFTWFLVWLFGSRRILLPHPSKKTVVFSFKVDREGERNYKRVLSEIQNQFDQLGLSSRIRVFVGAPDLIANRPGAHRYRDRWDVDLVVWGESLYGYLEEEKVLQFKVMHTTRVSGGSAQDSENYWSEIGLFVANRKWTIKELNELKDVVVVADEFFETILGIIGINLWVKNEVNDSLAIFESVLLRMKQRVQQEETSLDIRRSQHVQEIVCALSYRKAIEDMEHADYNGAIQLLERIQSALPKNTMVLMSLAYAWYHSGNLDKAKDYTWAIGRIDKRHPAVAMNVAFFAILEKNYRRAGYWYGHLLKIKKLREVNPLSVAAFLEKEHEDHPEEHALLYGAAIVNGLLDPEIKQRDLQEFLRRTEGRPEYSPLRTRATEILSSSR